MNTAKILLNWDLIKKALLIPDNVELIAVSSNHVGNSIVQLYVQGPDLPPKHSLGYVRCVRPIYSHGLSSELISWEVVD